MSSIGRDDASAKRTLLNPEMEKKLDDLLVKVQAISTAQEDVLARMSSVENRLEAVKKSPVGYHARVGGITAGSIGISAAGSRRHTTDQQAIRLLMRAQKAPSRCIKHL